MHAAAIRLSAAPRRLPPERVIPPDSVKGTAWEKEHQGPKDRSDEHLSVEATESKKPNQQRIGFGLEVFTSTLLIHCPYRVDVHIRGFGRFPGVTELRRTVSPGAYIVTFSRSQRHLGNLVVNLKAARELEIRCPKAEDE